MPEFAETLPESGNCRVEIIKSLQQPERGVRKRDATTHRVQIVDKPHQIIPSNGWHPLLIFLPIEYVADLIVKFGGRLIFKGPRENPGDRACPWEWPIVGSRPEDRAGEGFRVNLKSFLWGWVAAPRNTGGQRIQGQKEKTHGSCKTPNASEISGRNCGS